MKLKTDFLLCATILASFGISQAYGAYNPSNPNGSATSANSQPVVIASDQAALPLPTGAATSANQATGNSSLSSIATNTANIPASPSTAALQTTGNTTLSTIATNTTGAATSALQTSGNASLTTIAGAVTSSKVQNNIAQVGGSALALGQALNSGSIPVALGAPNTVTAAPFTAPSSTAYTAGYMVANSATYSSVVPISFNIAPANGVPVYVLKGKIQTQTSGGAGPSYVNGVFYLQLYGQAPTIASTSGDNHSFNATNANWCGTMQGTLLMTATDYTVAELVPLFGSAVTCAPAAGSTTIYGLLEAEAAFTPGTSNSTYTISLTAQ